jgi:dienelactone hydrolase
MSRRKLSRLLTAIGDASSPTRIDLDQAFDEFPGIKLMHDRTGHRGNASMDSLRWAISIVASLAEFRSPHRGSPDIYQQSFRGLVATLLLLFANLIAPSRADDQTTSRLVQEEIWALPLPLPMFAYLVRPVGDGPFPLVIMNHGVSLNPTGRSFFLEFRDAAKWFAKRGYLVVAPVGTGYGAAAIDIPEHGLYGPFFSKVGKCSNPNFRAPGLAIAQVDLWIIDYMTAEKRIVPKGVIVVGQSAGGWASIALSSLNPPQVKAIITFAAGRDGRVDGKPNSNCAPDKLVEATGEFGRTSRVPMLWIYIENDTFFDAALSKRMHEAFTAAGGKAEYHLVPPFGSDGHFFVGSPDAIPIWSPLVTKFLDEQG